ncbi:pre-mRNA cleavage complex 2 protein Pcf11 isoform X2 [Notolabrus celidotus]|uniref:pre-mRNA cleavage complex 2 protein Pcf11 isoform X2 n=1 Tax=Notolabrus celidotus TaxID=1203425 RepID=UPI00148F8CFE|nr:pre-mRNA cleavage complex 2 protein Pcf11 isoform X2 [Notolabrus celidotus]
MDCLLINGYATDNSRLGFPGSLGSKMDDAAARDDACREYQSSLEDLTFNSKPHINMLTILAEENLHFAKDIVAIIEAQISKAPTTEKLPVLYLVDSIVKNVGGEYVAVFSKNLITSFICVFEKVDENTRKSLFKLRSTWDDVFPLKKLYALDVRVNSVDPAWPIKPLPPTVNASIHVNPKFLKQSEEVSSPPPVQPAQQPPTKPPTKPPPAAVPTPLPPPPPPAPAVSQSSVTQEQLIRQQLLAKQKQLLELQQKKIELELEQTKAQLAGGFVMPVASAPPAVNPAQKPVSPPAPVVRPWIPPQTQPDTKPPTRDPRLNRSGPTAAQQPKEQHAGTKHDTNMTGGLATTPEKSRPEKTRTPKKEVLEEKHKSKSPSPMAKMVPSKTKQAETEVQKSAEGTKKDPRLKKRTQDKSGQSKDDELKEKKRCTDKKEREVSARGPESQRSNKGKLVNGSVSKHDREESNDKPELKSGGNARTHARKRARSRSRSRSPAASPKRKDRRSPKGHARSSSLSPSPSHKHGKPGREDRPIPKKNQPESRRSKRPTEKRHSETRDSHSPRGHEGGGKETKEAPHRWRSGWEDKHTKLPEDPHPKPGPQRPKQYGTPTRPTTPRTPKHRLSVDANMQIPEVLNSASKKDLLRRASQRLESGEISQEDFLNMVHQLNSFFQYQEEKQQHPETWDFPTKKPPLLTTPPSNQSRSQDGLNAAELSYYEHKSKLRKTQVSHRLAGEEWGEGESPQECEGAGQEEKLGGRSAGRRASQDRQGERRSKEHEEPHPPSGPMIEEYNHGKEFPTLKSLPGLRFRRRADPRETMRSKVRLWSGSVSGTQSERRLQEREWTSPLTERQRYEEQKSGYDAPRRYAATADPRHLDPRRPEGSLSGTMVHKNSQSPAGLEAQPPRFERERLSPLNQKDSAEASPVPRFESPNSEHSDDGPLDTLPQSAPKSILKAPGLAGLSVRQHNDSPGHTPPHDGGHAPSRYDPAHIGPSRQHPPGWFEGGGLGRYDDTSRFEGPHHACPGRFEGGGPHHNIPDRFDGPHLPHGPIRERDDLGRFEGPAHPPVSGRFDGPLGQQPPVRFEGQGPGPGHFGAPMQRFNNMAPGSGPAPGPGPIGFQQQGPIRFEGPPNQMGPMRFEGPMRFDGPSQSGPRFDLPNVPQQGGPPMYECAPGQQGPPRFGPQQNLQSTMRPMAPPIYDGPMAPQQNFNMAPQRFLEPLNPQFPGGPMGFQTQQNMQSATNFNMQPTPPFSQPGPAPFYNSAAPTVGMQQPVNMMNMNQPFLPQNTVPYTPAPVVPPENHFGQVDVNDLLTKLISNGIIKPSLPDTAPTAAPGSAAPPAASTTTTPTAAVVEEEEEQEEEDDDGDLPDLTSFSIDDMKQRYESVVTRLYSGNQCCLCSMRFTTVQTDMYADHLDWHFRQNHAGKVASKKITHRRWYYTLTDWIEFEEIADLEERAKSLFFEKVNEEEVQKTQAAAKEKEFQSVKAAKDQVGELCEICQEPFETYWVEEEEDWFLKNAIRVDDKNFHPSCFEDYKNSSYIDATPSPSKLTSEHPLTAFIKKEEKDEEETSCSVAAATAVAAITAAVSAPASQEVKSEESCELPEVKKEAELLTEVHSEEAAE